MEVLQAKEVGRLAGLTENAVKQWTIGRPYTIQPSIRHSPGKGVPNLYSLEDAFRFAVAIELTADGFQSSVIQRVLNSFDATAKTLLIRRGRIDFSHYPIFRRAKEEEVNTRQFVQRSFYVLDLQSLREALNDNWDQMLKKRLLYGANPPGQKGRRRKKSVDSKDPKTRAGR